MSPFIVEQHMTDVFNNIVLWMVSFRNGLIILFRQLTSIPIMVDQVDPWIVEVLMQIGYLLHFKS